MGNLRRPLSIRWSSGNDVNLAPSLGRFTQNSNLEYTVSQIHQSTNIESIDGLTMCAPEMPLAPATRAVSPWTRSGNTGRPW